jgi:hypothetical protein
MGRAFALSLAAAFVLAIAARAEPLASGIATERPECVTTAAGRADCLARNRYGQAVWTTYNNAAWSRPVILDASLAGPVSCVVRGPLGLNCFAVSTTGALHHIAFNGGRWGRWRSLGGELQAARVSCFAPQRDRISCLAVSKTGGLMLKSWLGDAVWQEWRQLSAGVTSRPSCVPFALDRMACYWRGTTGRLAGWASDPRGPGGFGFTTPLDIANRPACVPIGADRALCAALGLRPAGRPPQAVLWRSEPGGAGPGAVQSPDGLALAQEPHCAASIHGPLCFAATADGLAIAQPARDAVWENVPAGTHGLPACALLGDGKTACMIVDARGHLWPHTPSQSEALPPQTSAAASAAPPPPQSLAALPAPPVPPVPASAVPQPLPLPPAAPPPIATVSAAEPLGTWHVFEASTGRQCAITLFDAPAQPYRKAVLGPGCDALASLRNVDRWNAERGGIYLRDRRGRVFFRFFEAGPTALRAKWRRTDFVMLARDANAFSGRKPPLAQPGSAEPETGGSFAGFAGVWRAQGRGVDCVIRLTVDPDSAQTLARPEGCGGALQAVQGWRIAGGVLTLTGPSGGAAARFSPVRGGAWRGVATGSRRAILLSRQ